MFENYIYCNRNMIVSYISQIKNTKSKSVSLELTLPFLKMSSDFTFNKDITELSNEELCILFENIFIKYEGEYYFDLDENSVEYQDKMSKNTFIKKTAQFCVPDMAEKLDAIRGISSIKGLIEDKMGDFVGQDEQSQLALNFILENNLNSTIPIYTKIGGDIYYFNFENKNEDVIEKLDDDITIVGKIKSIKHGKVKVFDLLKEMLKVNRSLRRQISKNDEDKTQIYLEGNSIYEIEVLYITA